MNAKIAYSIIAIMLLAPVSRSQSQKVQVAVYQNKVPSNYFLNAGIEQEIHFQIDNNGFYRYFVGPFKNIEISEQIQYEMIDKGFLYSKIVDYNEGAKNNLTSNVVNLESASANKIQPSDAMHLLYFDTGAFLLDEQAKEELLVAKEQLLKHPNLKLKIAGHSDSKGSPVVNLLLSKKRVRSCRNFLITQAINPHRLVTVAFGESRPVAINKTGDGKEMKEGMKYNRRVVLSLMDGEQELAESGLEKFYIPSHLIFTPKTEPQRIIHAQVKE